MNTPDATQQTHTLNDLRGHLMATLAGLRDKQNPMAVDVARAMAQVGSVLVDTARVEVDYIKATKGRTSAFMQVSPPPASKTHPAVLAGYGTPHTRATDVTVTEPATREPEPEAQPAQATSTEAPEATPTPSGPAAIQTVWRHVAPRQMTKEERGIAR